MEQNSVEAAVTRGILKAVGVIALLVFAFLVLAWGYQERQKPLVVDNGIRHR